MTGNSSMALVAEQGGGDWMRRLRLIVVSSVFRYLGNQALNRLLAPGEIPSMKSSIGLIQSNSPSICIIPCLSV